MNDPNLKYALPAALFFALLAFLLFTHSTYHITQVTVLLALFCGALGQFLAQDNGAVQRVTAMALTLLAILLAAVATITFMIA
jgi:hypothetical protein